MDLLNASPQQHVYTTVSDYQVLQRDFSTNTAIVKTNNGTKTLPVGGPYSINGADHVLVGDVWVMSGQSNMRGNGFYEDPWTDPPTSYLDHVNNNIHLFQCNETWTLAQEPTHRLDQSIRQVNHNLSDPSVKDPKYHLWRGFSLGTSFATEYRKHMNNVPVGLIATAHGGTTLDEWSPSLMENTTDPYNNTLYGAMLARLRKQENQVAGILWYQGESDAEKTENAENYKDKFEKFITTTRERLDANQLPFLFVQIARQIQGGQDIDNEWSMIRDAQRLVNDDYDPKRVGAVTTIDLPMDDRIHLSAVGQKRVGQRLARAAANALLHDTAGATSPSFDSVTYQETNVAASGDPSQGRQYTLLVKFKNMDDATWEHVDDRVFGFSIRDSEGNNNPAIYKARIENDHKSVRLFITDVSLKALKSKDYFLYYGYGMDPICNLKTKDDIGLLAFGPEKIDFSAI